MLTRRGAGGVCALQLGQAEPVVLGVRALSFGPRRDANARASGSGGRSGPARTSGFVVALSTSVFSVSTTAGFTTSWASDLGSLTISFSWLAAVAGIVARKCVVESYERFGQKQPAGRPAQPAMATELRSDVGFLSELSSLGRTPLEARYSSRAFHRGGSW